MFHDLKFSWAELYDINNNSQWVYCVFQSTLLGMPRSRVYTLIENGMDWMIRSTMHWFHQREDTLCFRSLIQSFVPWSVLLSDSLAVEPVQTLQLYLLFKLLLRMISTGGHLFDLCMRSAVHVVPLVHYWSMWSLGFPCTVAGSGVDFRFDGDYTLAMWLRTMTVGILLDDWMPRLQKYPTLGVRTW